MKDGIVITGIGMIGPGAFGRAAVVGAFPALPRAEGTGRGLYVSDKMEFEGMIANIGLRFDLWDQNVSYYADQYSPFRYSTTDTSYVIDMTRALKAETPTIGRLQPRLGISFPVSLSTVFHVNYGTYVQRPPLNQTIFQQTPKSGFATMILGNPRLRPQVTNSYDIGVMQALAEGFTLDVSGYYKDVKDLIQQALEHPRGRKRPCSRTLSRRAGG